jgi:hypothetical protein
MSLFSAEHADRIHTKKRTVVVLVIDFALSNSLSAVPGWKIIHPPAQYDSRYVSHNASGHDLR